MTAVQNGAGLGASLSGIATGGGIQLASLPPQHQQVGFFGLMMIDEQFGSLNLVPLKVIQQLFTRLSQNPQQLAQMIKTLPQSTGQALTELLRQYAVAQV